MNMADGILIGPFRVTDASLDGNALAAGIPSPVAMMGFVDAVVRKVTGAPADVDCAAVMILHSVHVSVGQIRPDMEGVPAKKTSVWRGDRFVNNQMPEKLIGSVVASVLISPFGADTEALSSAVGKARFAAGGIFPLQGFRIPVQRVNGVGDAMKRIPSGYVVRPRPDLAPVSFGEAETLAGIAAHLGASKEYLDGRSVESVAEAKAEAVAKLKKDQDPPKDPPHRWLAKSKGWLVPVPIGYRSLESVADAKPREGARPADKVYPHILVEDGVGLAECVSTGRVRRSDMNFDEVAWKWHVDLERGRFIVGPPRHAY